MPNGTLLSDAQLHDIESAPDRVRLVLRERLSTLLILVLLSTYCLAVGTNLRSGFGVATANDDEIPFNFIAYGDTRNDTMPHAVSSLHDNMIDLYLAHNPELILHTGDLALLGGNWTQLLEFNASMADVWDSGVPFYSAPGNHETYIGGWVEDHSFTNYTQYVHYEDVAAACGGTELYFSFDYGGVHFVILNTEDSWVGDVFQCSTEQITWLQTDLANVEDDTFLVVAFHRPAYSVREARPDRWAEARTIRDEFHSLFLQHDVDLVLTGHDHHYYRTVRDGIYYVVTGGGGAPPAGIDESATAWREGDVGFNEFHYCNVQVNSSHIAVDVQLMNGTTADSFTLPKLNPTDTTTTTTTSTTTTTTTTATTTSTESTQPTPPQLMTCIIIGVGAVALTLIVVVFLRRSGS